MTTYRIEAHGRTHTRRSDARYVAASVRQDGRVRWHRSAQAARRAAGTYGRVVDVSDQAPRHTAADDDARYEVETSATGTVTVWRITDDGRVIADRHPAGTDEATVEASIERDRARRS